ncbi:MAG: sugar ABC transporter permease [Chloroflexota bacterium]|nr:sugar ABC transporter permease [Chloroflexota bacterium]
MDNKPVVSLPHGNTRSAGHLIAQRSKTNFNLAIRGMLLPYLLGTLLLVILPGLLTFALAFTEYDALSPPIWRGFGNFHDVLVSPLFWIALRNSLYFAVLAIPLRLLGALAFALLLKQRRRGVGLYRAAIYLPTVIPDVAYALIWLWIFNPLYGPLNMLLSAAGLPAPAWLVNPQTAKLAIVIMSLFQIGEGFVVLLAGLHDIPDEYYAAAAIDGGNRWQMFRFITLPLLAPWLLLLTIRDLTLSAQNTFTPAYLMTDGGPYFSTLFMPLLIFDEAFERFRIGMGSAILLLFFLGLGLLVVLVYFVAGGWGYADDY